MPNSTTIHASKIDLVQEQNYLILLKQNLTQTKKSFHYSASTILPYDLFPKSVGPTQKISGPNKLNNKIFFVFLFRKFKMSLGVRQALKVYSGILGLFVSLFAFIWVFFMVYLVSDTPESEHDLRMARYLDICFGLLAFFSSLALMYGAFVESKTWISAWTLGSGTVVVGMWAWYFHRKFSQTPHPEGLYLLQFIFQNYKTRSFSPSQK